MSKQLEQIQKQLERLADSKRAAISIKFFKTGRGEYGEGDLFRGIRVPELRRLARTHAVLSLSRTETLLKSGFHEDRLLALLILVRVYSKGNEDVRQEVFDLYLRNMAFINNWDLVDCSAEYIIGPHISNRSKALLQKMARSNDLWERRIAVLATFHYIKSGRFDHTFQIAKLLLNDKADLIHKAVGWMLREIGKRDQSAEETFLKRHYRKMPRTMLRYAIERFPQARRRAYLNGSVGSSRQDACDP